jgi:hypothetical protein
MTERLQPAESGSRRAPRRTPRSRAERIWGARTIPAATARDLATRSEPTLFGLPAEIVTEDDTAERLPAEATPEATPDATTGAPPSDVGLVVRRRADRFGGGALVLAGVAANVSLSLSWSPGDGPSGLYLVQRGVDALRSGTGDAISGVWHPLVVVLSGGVLVLLGFLLLVPARAHRVLGVLALVVSLAAGAAVVVLMANVGWTTDRFGPGMWCAVVVPMLGMLGSLKAMLTAPRVELAAR